MHKLVYLILLSICLFFNSSAQSISDTSQINGLLELINEIDPSEKRDTILSLLDQANNKVGILENNNLKNEYLREIANQYLLINAYEKAEPIFQNVLQHYKLAGNTAVTATIKNRLARMSRNQGNPTKGLEYAHSGLADAIASKDTSIIIDSYWSTAAAYITHKVIDTLSILKYGNEMFEIALHYGEPEAIGRGAFVGGIANIYGGFFDKSIDLFKMSSENYLLAGDTARSMGSIAKIGNVYEVQGMWRKALPYYESFHDYTEENGHFDQKITALIYLTNCLLELKDPEYVQRNLIPILKDALKWPQIHNQVYERTMIYEYIRNAYSKVDDYQKAFEWSEKLMLLKDSTLNEQHSQALADMETKYETNKKEQEIELLSEQQKVQEAQITASRNQNIVLIALLGMLLLAGGVFYYRNQLKQQLKLQSMRTQISSDLHDEVGSSLTHLSMIMNSVDLDSNVESSKNYLLKGNEILMGSISKIRDVVWAIDSRNDETGNLLDRMEDFAFDLLKPKEVDYEFNTKGFDRKMKLSPLVRQNVYLIFKEAINNIVKHSNATQVDIDFEKTGDNLNLRIKDNGSLQKGQKVKGSGLSNMKLRAKRVKGNIEIESEKDGFSVKLNVPL